VDARVVDGARLEIDAPIDAALPDAATAHADAREHHHRPVDAGVVATIAAPQVAEVATRVGLAPGSPPADIHIVAPHGMHCDGSSLPVTCHAVPSAYEVVLRITGGEDLTLRLTVDANATRCFVRISDKQITCKH
jgi:hypothetical protein